MDEAINETMDEAMDKEFIFYGKWVLVNAFFFTFWITRDEFDKFLLNYK